MISKMIVMKRLGVLAGGLIYAGSVLAATERINESESGAQANAQSRAPVVSADGRFVAFYSSATNLMPGVAGGVFVRDRANNTLELISQSTTGNIGAGINPVITANGRYVVFSSLSPNLVPNDTNTSWDIFLRDRVAGTTERVSLTSSGAEVRASMSVPSIDSFGQVVAWATNGVFVPEDVGGLNDIYFRDLQTGITKRASIGLNGQEADASSYNPVVSGDGRYIAFVSSATNLVSGFGGGSALYAYDRNTDSVILISVGGNSPRMSSDGCCIVYWTALADLSSDTNGKRDVYVYDFASSSKELISLTSSGAQGDGDSGAAAISANTRFVAFSSVAGNFDTIDTNGKSDIYLRDRTLQTTTLISMAADGTATDLGTTYHPSVTDYGDVAYESDSTNIVAGDTNGVKDLFFKPYDNSCRFPVGQNDLIGKWSAEGNANDSVGNNNGSIIGNVTYGSGTNGQAFVFPGSATTDSRVEIADSTTLQLNGAFTLRAQVKFEAVSPATGGINNSPIVAKWGRSGDGSASYGLFVWTDGRPFLAVEGAGYSKTQVDAPTPLPIGEFATVEGIWTGTKLELYVNGRLQASKDFTGTINPAVATPLLIGGYIRP